MFSRSNYSSKPSLSKFSASSIQAPDTLMNFKLIDRAHSNIERGINLWISFQKDQCQIICQWLVDFMLKFHSIGLKVST